MAREPQSRQVPPPRRNPTAIPPDPRPMTPRPSNRALPVHRSAKRRRIKPTAARRILLMRSKTPRNLPATLPRRGPKPPSRRNRPRAKLSSSNRGTPIPRPMRRSVSRPQTLGRNPRRNPTRTNRVTLRRVASPATRATLRRVASPATRATLRRVASPATRATLRRVASPATRATLRRAASPATRAIPRRVASPATRAIPRRAANLAIRRVGLLHRATGVRMVRSPAPRRRGRGGSPLRGGRLRGRRGRSRTRCSPAKGLGMRRRREDRTASGRDFRRARICPSQRLPRRVLPSNRAARRRPTACPTAISTSAMRETP